MRSRITATERDAIVADVREIMLRHRLTPYTLHKMAEVAAREAREVVRSIAA